MELKDLLNLNQGNIKELIRSYLQQPAEYRLKNNFEEYIFEAKICNICEEMILPFEEYVNDDTKAYGESGYCHEECFKDAQKGRL